MMRTWFTAAVALSLIPAAAFADAVIRFDLGSPEQRSGADWNDIPAATRTGLLLDGAVTTRGERTGVSYGHVRAFAGIDGTGHTGGSLYPSRATRDGFTLGTPGKRDAVIEIGGLSPAKSYDFRFYGSVRDSGASRRTEIGIGQRSEIGRAHV